MNDLFIYGSSKFMLNYNCSGHTVEEWTALEGERRSFIGAFCIIFGVSTNMLYILCLQVLATQEYSRYPCYKLMFAIGVNDVVSQCIASIFHGIMISKGVVFCTYPDMLYIVGCVTLGLWATNCFLMLALVVNRVFDFFALTENIFNERVTAISIGGSIIYGLGFTIFHSPPLLNSKYAAWFFEPHFGSDEVGVISKLGYALNNSAVVGATFIFYLILFIILGCKMRKMGANEENSRFRRLLLTQTVVINLVIFLSSILYVMMQHFHWPAFYSFMVQCGWQIAHAFPIVNYIIVNRSIRIRVAANIYRPFFRGSSDSSVHPANC